MKKLIILSLLLGVVPMTMLAQDDLYFTPKKSSKVEPVEDKSLEKSAYYRGSDRDVDEYNRRKLRSYYEKVVTDSLGNDVIEFVEGNTGSPDTIFVYDGFDDFEDFVYSRRMGHFDGFYGWYNPYFYSYWGWGRPYWRSSYYWGWYDPWYSWYDPWYTPWYGYYGWGWSYRPYYYGWGGWYPPVGGIAYRDGHTGTQNHGRPTFNRNAGSAMTGTFGGARTGTFGSRPAASSSNANRVNVRPNGSSGGSFGGTRTNGTTTRSSGTYNNQPARSSSNNSGSFGSSRSSGFGGGSSVGGSRSGGGSFSSGGGSRSGGSFGGRR